jgi:hypothetical protein
MPAKAKTLLIWIVVIFLIYAVVTNPDAAANIVTAIWEFVLSAFSGFGQFFASLAS